MTSTSRNPLLSDTEALATLSEYLELALDKAGTLIMVRGQTKKSDLYVGDASAPCEEWTGCGAIRHELANAILEATRSGFNQLDINGQTYRFLRTFTQAGNHGAVIFTAV